MATINLKEINVKQALPLSFSKNPKVNIVVEGVVKYGRYIFNVNNNPAGDTEGPVFDIQLHDAHIVNPDKTDPLTCAINNSIKKADAAGYGREFWRSFKAKKTGINKTTGEMFPSRLGELRQIVPDYAVVVMDPETKTAKQIEKKLLDQLYKTGPAEGTVMRLVMGINHFQNKKGTEVFSLAPVGIIFVGEPTAYKPSAPAFLEAMGLTMEEEEPAEEESAEEPEAPAEEAPEVKAPAEAPAEEEVEDDVFGDEDF